MEGVSPSWARDEIKLHLNCDPHGERLSFLVTGWLELPFLHRFRSLIYKIVTRSSDNADVLYVPFR